MAERHPDWVLGFADEGWWSRLTQPQVHSWVPAEYPLRLVEKTRATTDSDPKALACYGLLLRAPPATVEQIGLRCATGQPGSALTTHFLAWCCDKLATLGKRVLLLIWDNASWHISKRVRTWLQAHNRQVRQTGKGVRIVTCLLPTKSPWLNPIEPKWKHGKRAVAEPNRVLPGAELEARAYAYYGCEPQSHLVISEKAA